MPITVKPVDAAAIEEARRRLAGLSRITPLIPLETALENKAVTLKLECLQPIGCFKIRPIGNAVLAKERSSLARGIYTTSSGNSALGVAWMARRLGLAATAVVPENAPPVKLAGLRRLGARIDMRSMAEWWRAIETGAERSVNSRASARAPARSSSGGNTVRTRPRSFASAAGKMRPE